MPFGMTLLLVSAGAKSSLWWGRARSLLDSATSFFFPGSRNDYLPRTNKETQIPRTSHRDAARCACRRIPGNSARPNGGDFSPRLDPAARPDDHQNHSAHGGCNAEEHKENAPRESGADSIYSGGTGDIRRLLASGTCHQRGDEIHPKQAKPHK